MKMQFMSMLLLKHGKIGHATKNRDIIFFVKHSNLDDTKVKKVINSSFWEVDKVSYSPGNFKDIYQVFCMLILLKGKR